ncbi:MAG: hypothetical protein AABX77_01705 [Nanoarchaeota archaeon]
MAKWTGWVAALGGVLAGLPSVAAAQIASWSVPLGAVLAIVFGIWSVYE